MKILVDAMGGDNAPLCVLQGVSQAAAEFGDGMELVLLGEEKAIRDCAKRIKSTLHRLRSSTAPRPSTCTMTRSRPCATKRIPAL